MSGSESAHLVIVAGFGIGAFSVFCPAWHEIAVYAGRDREAFIRRVRIGEVAAVASIIFVGMLVGDSTSVALAVMVALVLAAFNEYAIANPA